MAFLLFSDVILKTPVKIILDSRIGRENIQTLATLYPILDKGNGRTKGLSNNIFGPSNLTFCNFAAT